MNRTTATIALLTAACAATAAPKAYIASLDGTIHRLVPGGDLELVVDLGSPLTAIAASSDHLVVGDFFGRVSRVDPASGAVLDLYQVWHGVGVNAVAVDAQGHIFVADHLSSVAHLNAAGDEVDTYYSGLTISAMLEHEGELLIGSPNTLIYSAPFGVGLGEPGFDMISACGGIVNSLALTPDHLFAGDLNGTVYRFAADGGAYQTTFATSTDAKAVGIVAAELLVLGSDGTLERLDPISGALLGVLPIGLPAQAMTVADFACLADVEADGQLNIDDLDTFVAAFAGQQPAADLNASGTWTVDDIDAFIAAFSIGCP